MVKTIKEYLNEINEGTFLLHSIDDEDIEETLELQKIIEFTKCELVADSETLEFNFDNGEVFEIMIDDICDVSIIFGELIIILEDLTRITFTF